MKKTLCVMLVIVLLALLPAYTVIALQTEIVPVDPSPYYDNNAQVWGNYIVWRRAINIDNDPYIDFGTEPSWIMVNNIVTGETWNITPANVKSPQSGDTLYEWAEAPSIWNGHVIYEYTYGDEAYETRIYMYNISSNETWDVPFPTTYQAGHSCFIYDDWIMATHYGTSYRQLYLYNYRTTEFKTLISASDPHTASYVGAYGNFVVYTRYNPSTVVYDIAIFNLSSSSYQTVILDGTDAGINSILFDDIYDDKIVIDVLEVTPTSSWNLYLYDISAIDWTTVGIEETYQWNSHISSNVTPIDVDFTSDARYGSMWGEWIVYADYPGSVGSTAPNVRAVNYVSNRTMNLTYSGYYQFPQDMYMDKLVFTDNKNSDTNFGNATDNYDIYRLQTDIESLSLSIWAILPLIMVAMAAVAIGAAAKVFGGVGGGGGW